MKQSHTQHNNAPKAIYKCLGELCFLAEHITNKSEFLLDLLKKSLVGTTLAKEFTYFDTNVAEIHQLMVYLDPCV